MINVDCPHCGLRILVPPTVQGKRGVCFNCGTGLIIPRTGKPLQRKDLSFSQGDSISDRYAIQEAIGRGGMGVVYRAHDTLVDEEVALKFMHPELLRTQRGQQLFIREAQVARRLRHENIVAVHDVSWTPDGILYLSMEYIEGQSLRSYLRKQRENRKHVDVRLAVTFIRQVLAALENAHRTVIHRDIKPENVMLLAAEQVKVLDFGLAKAVQAEYLQESSGGTPDSERKKRVVGTLAYAAPEQCKSQSIDRRADIYAVGLVFHELLTLRTPLDKPATVARVRNDVSPSLQAVLDRALEEEKEARWPSAREFRKALETAFDESYRKSISQIHVTKQDAAPSTDGMVFLEGGSFLMGNDNVREQAPEAEVHVAAFWMDTHPVTVGEYENYLKETGRPEPRFWRDPRCNGPSQPAIGVTWAEARAYAEWAGKTLPSDTEWEFAARGRGNRKYPWGDLPPDTTRANFQDYLAMPSIVTMHEDGQTPDGILDLAGNIWEWTRDPFVPYTKLRRDPEAAENAPRRSVRGGCFHSPPEELVCTFRQGLFPEAQQIDLGFRCVVPAEHVSE